MFLDRYIGEAEGYMELTPFTSKSGKNWGKIMMSNHSGGGQGLYNDYLFTEEDFPDLYKIIEETFNTNDKIRLHCDFDYIEILSVSDSCEKDIIYLKIKNLKDIENKRLQEIVRELYIKKGNLIFSGRVFRNVRGRCIKDDSGQWKDFIDTKLGYKIKKSEGQYFYGYVVDKHPYEFIVKEQAESVSLIKPHFWEEVISLNPRRKLVKFCYSHKEQDFRFDSDSITIDAQNKIRELFDTQEEYIINHIDSFKAEDDITFIANINVNTNDFYYYISNNENTLKELENQSHVFERKISNIYAEKLKGTKKKYLKLSFQVAKAAIMSRNMSHNLGSHVMSYVKQSLSSVDNMFHDNVVAQLFKDEAKEEISFPFLLGLGHFFSYLQERQDFIATIATDHIPNYSTVNFKDHIYDELNPDKRYQRHKDHKNLEIDNILLGNIAQSEGLGRKTSPTKDTSLADIVLKFRNFAGDTPDAGSPAEKNLEEMRRYELSLPGGIVGRQAIFSIVENVIRNAAKHGNWRDAGKLELTFDIYDYIHDRDSERISIDDKIDDESLSLQEVLKRYYFSSKDKYDNYIITLTDNLSVSKESLGNLRRALNEEYVDPETGTISDRNKGIKEMRISSAWIRSLDKQKEEFTVSYLSQEQNTLTEKEWQNDKHWYYEEEESNKISPLIYARISKSKEGTQGLQYIFCVPIPKTIAVVSNNIDVDILRKANTKLYEKGWRIFSPKDFLDIQTDKSFEFVILDDKDEDKDLYKKIRQKTSSRLNRISELNSLYGLVEQINTGKIDDIDFNGIYSQLYCHLAAFQENDKIAILDSKATARHKDALQAVAIPRGGSYLSAAGGKVSISDGVKVEPYIYRTHHDSKSEFLNFMKDCAPGGVFQNFKYVEGISGNNSTDRIVRNEAIDDIWFFKHLHAMKTKVAIFDERIFSKVFGLKESDFFEDIIVTDNNIRDVKSDIAKKYPEDILQLPSLRTPDAIKEYLKGKGFPKECDVNSDNFTAKVFEQKNVFVYSLIRSKVDASVYHLVGLKDFKKKEAEFVCCCGRLASFSWDIKKEELIINSTAELRGQFDKISIHQGLLDKLYTAFGIRNHDNEAALKEKLTYYFYKFFSKSEGKDAIEFLHEDSEYKGWFLPGMVIHSGRSKPGEKDMPQLLPFIQYASIEHTVFDCKLSLVELLDFARYE